MSVNTPDKWVVIKITNQSNETHYRVFACWYGGYIGSDSWQMNSGITKVNLVNNFYEFIGSSGSVYRCHINSYGTSGYGQSVLNNFINKSEELTIEVMSEDTDYITLEYSE